MGSTSMCPAFVTAFYLCHAEEQCDWRLCDGLSPRPVKEMCGGFQRSFRTVNDLRPSVTFLEPPSWNQPAPSILAPREGL